MLYVASLTFSKLSALAFMTFLMQRTRKAEWVLIALISAWAVAAEFAVAFQCDLPQPWRWNQTRCFNRVRYHALTEFEGYRLISWSGCLVDGFRGVQHSK